MGRGIEVRRGSVKKDKVREETHHRCPKKEMAATPSGDTILCVDYDNYSPRYSYSASAPIVNDVVSDYVTARVSGNQ